MHFNRQQPAFFVMGGFLAIALAFLVFWLVFPERLNQSKPVGSIHQSTRDFFTHYWERPIPPQGPAPASFTEREGSLSPEACGSCHAQQYADWKESLHSKAMGPGPWGQIMDLTQRSPEEAIQCMSCHAPLSEQLPLIAKAKRKQENLR